MIEYIIFRSFKKDAIADVGFLDVSSVEHKYELEDIDIKGEYGDSWEVFEVWGLDGLNDAQERIAELRESYPKYNWALMKKELNLIK
jgi:Na+-transporting NADH:ubiquinone oxidoreductase subunit NqrF